MKKTKLLQFTFEEQKSLCSPLDIDAYIAAGVSTEIDCELSFGPPAGPIEENPFGLRFLCVSMLQKLNALIEQGDEAGVWECIKKSQEYQRHVQQDASDAS